MSGLARRALLIAAPLGLAACGLPLSVRELRAEQNRSLAVADRQSLPLLPHPPLTSPPTRTGFHLAAWPAHGRTSPGVASRLRGLRLRHEVQRRPGDGSETGGTASWSEPDRLWIGDQPITLPGGLGGRSVDIELALLPQSGRLLLLAQAHEYGPLWFAIVNEQGERLLDWRRRGAVRLQPLAEGLVAQFGDAPAQRLLT